MSLNIRKASIRKSFHIFIVCMAILSVIVIGLFFVFKDKNPALAAIKEDWKAGDIISDANFTNKDSMSVADIQAFLDEKIGGCDIWGTGKATEFGSNQTRAQYAASRGWAAPPYTCLNKYYEVPKASPGGTLPANNYSNPSSIPNGAQSAAWIIKDAANRYNISPKVLLVKIATESAGPLTTDKWPLFSQYRYAMGSHCPDSGPNGSANCDPNYAGFSIQMYSAAQLMRWYLDSMDQPWWSYKKPYQDNQILWNVVERNCGSGNVYIENKATAALYTYTPYQPNTAALNNLYGTGDNCSAYGNRNVWRVYWDWFGNSRTHEEVKDMQSKKSDSIKTGESLKSGDFITSNNGRFMLAMQHSGQLVLYGTRQAQWTSGSVDWSKRGNRLTLQDDGNLVLYNEANQPIWASNTSGKGAVRLTIQGDGNLVLYTSNNQAVWATDTGRNVADSKYIGSSLDKNQPMVSGDYLRSSDWRYFLTMQSDGNLVLYTAGYTQPIWASNTSGKGGKYVTMQSDGNLVMYSDKGPIWASNTSGKWQSARLNLQTDGNLVVYGFRELPIWASNTSGKGGKYVTMQSDGNLVMYSDKGPIWASNTSGKWQSVASFQCTISGSLGVNTQLKIDESLCSNNSDYRLLLQPDGNLVTYIQQQSVSWASHTGGVFFRSNLNL